MLALLYKLTPTVLRFVLTTRRVALQVKWQLEPTSACLNYRSTIPLPWASMNIVENVSPLLSGWSEYSLPESPLGNTGIASLMRQIEAL